MFFEKSIFHYFSQLKLEVKQANAASTGLQAQMKEMEQKVSALEQRLKDHGAKCRELASLRNRVDELQSLTQSQEQSLAQSQREVQQNQAELASLEAILALLHLREVEKTFLPINQSFAFIPTHMLHTFTIQNLPQRYHTGVRVHINTNSNHLIVTLNFRVRLVLCASGPACYPPLTIWELHNY